MPPQEGRERASPWPGRRMGRYWLPGFSEWRTPKGGASFLNAELLRRCSAAPRGVRGDRVARLELTFDTIGLWQQLTRASRSPVAEPYAAVPNTLEDALQDSKDARVVTSATRPFVIEHASTTPGCASAGLVPTRPWARPWRASRGPPERDEITKIVDQAARGHACSALITNYTKQGQRF